MGCNADKDMWSDIPCAHRRVLECQDCRCTFAVRYTDDIIQSLLDRVKELESKLGATDRTSAVTAAKPMRPAESATGTTAAPSVSGYIRWGTEHQQDDIFAADRLAAAVTEWWQANELDATRNDEIEERLFWIVDAFVRGEPLPQKGG